MSSVFEDFPKVRRVETLVDETKPLDVLILAAGFEDRAFHVLSNGIFSPGCLCVLVRYRNVIGGLDQIASRFLSQAQEKFGPERVTVLDLSHQDPHGYEDALFSCLARTSPRLGLVGIDVSGMPAYCVCSTLKAVRDLHVSSEQLVFYSAAREYNPSHAEYLRLTSGDRDEIELLPRSMALEMAEVLILRSFSGYRSHSARSCLAIFAGYEAHRANGMVEEVNPALLLLMYGRPGDERFAWRLDLSQRLHRKFERQRPTASEVVSTLEVKEALFVLDDYYDKLIDDYDLVVAPIGSKMNSVAAFLFWERYGETRIAFPIPIGYNVDYRPTGTSDCYVLRLPPRLNPFPLP